jgi:hypothetical protein
VHGREMLYYPPRERGDRLMGSASVVGAYIALVVGVVVSIYLLRYSLQRYVDATYASVVASVLNTLQILIFNFVYARVVKQVGAGVLDVLESHKRRLFIPPSCQIWVF